MDEPFPGGAGGPVGCRFKLLDQRIAGGFRLLRIKALFAILGVDPLVYPLTLQLAIAS